MTKAIHKRKCVIWGSCFQRVRVHDYHDGEPGGNMAAGLPAWPWSHRYDTWIWDTNTRKLTGSGSGFGNIETHPQWHTFSNKATPPNPSQIDITVEDESIITYDPVWTMVIPTSITSTYLCTSWLWTQNDEFPEDPASMMDCELKSLLSLQWENLRLLCSVGSIF